MTQTQLLPQQEVSVSPDPEFGLSDRLRKAREHAGFKDQRSFAATLGIAQKSVSNYESGKTTPNRLVLREWSRVTGVRLEWLLGGAWPGEAARLGRRQPALIPSEQPSTLSRWTVYPYLWSYRISANEARDARDAASALGQAA